jgi:hypothetical protein
MPDHVPQGTGVYLHRGCKVGVQGVQKGGAELMICEAIVRGTQSGGRALPASPRHTVPATVWCPGTCLSDVPGHPYFRGLFLIS